MSVINLDFSTKQYKGGELLKRKGDRACEKKVFERLDRRETLAR